MRLFRRRPLASDWLPLSYEQAVALPAEPMFRHLGEALTADGRLLVTIRSDSLGPLTPKGRSRDLRWAGWRVREMRREAEVKDRQ